MVSSFGMAAGETVHYACTLCAWKRCILARPFPLQAKCVQSLNCKVEVATAILSLDEFAGRRAARTIAVRTNSIETDFFCWPALFYWHWQARHGTRTATSRNWNIPQKLHFMNLASTVARLRCCIECDAARVVASEYAMQLISTSFACIHRSMTVIWIYANRITMFACELMGRCSSSSPYI